MSYLVDEKQEDEREVVLMRDMQPLQVGRVIDNEGGYDGHIVMRTTRHSQNGEVMNLTNIGDSWTNIASGLLVELLPRGEKLTLVLCND